MREKRDGAKEALSRVPRRGGEKEGRPPYNEKIFHGLAEEKNTPSSEKGS